MHDHLAALDAQRRYDPTGTTDLRARFRSDLDRRWAQIRRLAVQAITGADDLLGLGPPGTQTFIRAHDPVRGFQTWIDAAMGRIVLANDGGWTQAYLDEAAARGRNRAYRLVSATTKGELVNHHHIVAASAATELQGVV